MGKLACAPCCGTNCRPCLCMSEWRSPLPIRGLLNTWILMRRRRQSGTMHAEQTINQTLSPTNGLPPLARLIDVALLSPSRLGNKEDMRDKVQGQGRDGIEVGGRPETCRGCNVSAPANCFCSNRGRSKQKWLQQCFRLLASFCRKMVPFDTGPL